MLKIFSLRQEVDESLETGELQVSCKIKRMLISTF